MGNYEEFISFFDENENNFIELTKIIKSDNNSLIDNFIQKYSNTEIRDPRFIKLSELFYSKGYTLSNSVLYRYINYISNLNEIQNIISSFKQNCREEIIDCIEFYLSIDFEENNRKVKSALIEYVNITFGNRFTIDKLDEMISDSKKSLILRNFEQNLKNDGYDKIDIDLLTGYEFENYLSKLFTGMGYIVEETKLAGDQGADLVIEKMGVKTVVQAKRYNSNVGNSAIQEIVASKNLYNADEAMVVTNSFFTQSAIQLAKSNNVKLIDRDSLNKMIENSIY
jgi:restriction endonuclease Mrr